MGDINRVTIEHAYLLEIKDAIVVHNHPQGTSFSKEDIEAICQFDAKEMVLVTRDFLHRIRRPEKGWGIDFSTELTQQHYDLSIVLAEGWIMKAVSRNEIGLYEKDIEILSS